MKNLLSTLAVSSLAFSACGPIDDMKEMKKTTAEMEQTTKELAEVSKKMNKSTTRIDDSAGNTYRDMRLDTSVSNGFKALNEMEAANSMEQKMIAAAYYMASFEFQIWKNKDLDGELLRQKMYALAVKRLFADMKEYVSTLDDAQILPTSGGNNLKNLYAMAAMLHEINPNQEVMSEVNGVKLTSVLDLITDGLQAVAQRKSGHAPEYQKIVAQNEEFAVLLLQLRYNIFTLKTLKMVSHIDDGFTTKAAMYLSSWQPDFSGLTNDSKMEFAAKVMALTLDTRHRLTSMGYKIADLKLPLGRKFSWIMKNMDLSKHKGSGFASVNLLVKSLEDLKNYYK